jgi:hypothetical protein
MMTSMETCAVTESGQPAVPLRARRTNITNEVAGDLILKLQVLSPLVIGRILPKGFWTRVP